MTNSRARLLRLASAVAVLLVFAACGAWSSQFYTDRGTRAILVGVPFALLCGLLFVRSSLAVLILPGIVCLWPAVRFAGMLISAASQSGTEALSLGGLIGGLSVTAALGCAHPRLLSPWWLIGAAAVGSVAALPFAPWLANVDYRMVGSPVVTPIQVFRLQRAFAIWQAAIGTYLYVATTVSDPPRVPGSRPACW